MISATNHVRSADRAQEEKSILSLPRKFSSFHHYVQFHYANYFYFIGMYTFMNILDFQIHC